MKEYYNIEKDSDILENIKKWIGNINNVDRVQIKQKDIHTITPKGWDAFFNMILPHMPTLSLRIYGGGTIDISFLSKYINIQNIRIEADECIDNIEVLANFKNLKTLFLTFNNQDNLDFLNKVNPALEELTIYASTKKRKNIDLSPISTFKNLKSLRISEYNLNLENVIKGLRHLEELQLRCINFPNNIDFITHLQNLKTLIIQSGKICDLNSLSKMESIKYLQLYRISLEDVNFISSMKGLQSLHLETMNGVSKLPSIHVLKKLRRLMIISCKNLRDFSEIEYSDSLTDFIFQNAVLQDPIDFIPILKSKTIKDLGIGFAKASKQKEMQHLMTQYGKVGGTYMYPQFKNDFIFE